MDTSPSFEEFVTHSDGFGDCKFFSLLGRDYLLSCGADGDIRILDLSGDREPIDLYIGSAPLYQLACISGPTPGVLFACEDNVLYWTEFNPSGFSKHKKKIVTRFSSAVYCVSTDLAGTWIAAGAADFSIKLLPAASIISTTQPTCHVLDTHLAPVLSLSFSADGLILCSASCDGKMLIWCTESRTVKHKIPVLYPKVSDLSLSPSRLVVALSRLVADRYFIATPQISADEAAPSISVYSSNNCKLIERLVSDTGTDCKSSGAFHCSAWSPDGLYLAAGTSMGHVLIWSYSIKEMDVSFSRVAFLRHTLRGEVVSVAWGVSSKTGKLMLAAFTKSGYLLLHDYLELPASPVEATAAESSDNLLEGIEAADLFDSQDSQPYQPVNGSQDVLENVGESENSLGFKLETSPVKSTEINARKKRKFVPEWEEDLAIYEPGELSQSCQVPVPQPEPRLSPQKSLQPSSWPPFSQIPNCEHVCLCYNLVGVVISHKSLGSSEAEIENKHFNFLIEVEFHDRGVHHPLQLIDPHWFSVGLLTEELLVLGSSGKRNVDMQGKNQSLIQVHNFNTWDGSKEWNAQLPEGEATLCLAAGTGWIVVVSDASILRLFGSNGTQFDLLKMPGCPVTCAGRGNRMVGVYHQNSALVESQNMSFYLLDVSGMNFALLGEGSLAISLNSELRWIGFTSSLAPVILDSLGQLEVGRVNSRGVLWAPMLDFNKVIRKKKNIPKVVMLGITPCLVEPSEEEDSVCNEEIRYLTPPHGSDFPSLYPRPSVQCVTYNPPFCSISEEMLSLEQRYFLSTLCYGKAARRTQEELMRLFAFAARAGSFQRAMEAGALLNRQYQQVAMTYSSRLQLSMLCQKMSSLFEAGSSTPDTETDIPMDSETDPTLSISQAEHEFTLSQDIPLVSGEDIGTLLSAIRSTSVSKDTNIFSSAPSNPFKNQRAASSRASSIDNNFIQSVIKKSLGDKHGHTSNENKQQTASVFSKQTKLGESRPERTVEVVESAESSNDKPATFRQWLEQSMPQLEADNPTLKKGELIQIATKKWREGGQARK